MTLAGLVHALLFFLHGICFGMYIIAGVFVDCFIRFIRDGMGYGWCYLLFATCYGILDTFTMAVFYGTEYD